MRPRRSSELLIIRLPAACMIAGTALILVLSAPGSCPEGQGCPLSEVHGCGVATLQIKTHHVSARAGPAEPIWQYSEARRKSGPEELPAALPIHAASDRLVLDRRPTGCEQLLRAGTNLSPSLPPRTDVHEDRSELAEHFS